MRYVVIGAGAVGGVVGGLLADAGHDVVLVARGAHGDALRKRGLDLRLPARDLHLRVPVAASVREVALRRGDAVLLAVKSHQTAPVLEDLVAQPVLHEPGGEGVPVLHLQNGVANEDLALRSLPAVHGVCVNLPATHLEPGVVEGEGSPVSGVLELGLAAGGSDEVDEVVAADLRSSGFDAAVRDDVMAWKRAKLLRNLGNAPQALFGRRSGEEARAASRRIRDGALAEGRTVFAAARLAVADDERWRIRVEESISAASVHGRERRGGSTWQSLERGADGVETDFLNGEIVRLGGWTGVPTPVNRLLVTAMHRLVADGGAPGSVRPEELVHALQHRGAQP